MSLRSCNLLRTIPRKPIQPLQRIQPRNSPSILNPITKERSQHLHLLPRQKLRRERLDNSRQIRNRFSANNGVVVVYVFAEGLHDVDKGGLLVFDIFFVSVFPCA